MHTHRIASFSVELHFEGRVREPSSPSNANSIPVKHACTKTVLHSYWHVTSYEKTHSLAPLASVEASSFLFFQRARSISPLERHCHSPCKPRECSISSGFCPQYFFYHSLAFFGKRIPLLAITTKIHLSFASFRFVHGLYHFTHGMFNAFRQGCTDSSLVGPTTAETILEHVASL
jgi:hypothetical protein